MAKEPTGTGADGGFRKNAGDGAQGGSDRARDNEQMVPTRTGGNARMESNRWAADAEAAAGRLGQLGQEKTAADETNRGKETDWSGI